MWACGAGIMRAEGVGGFYKGLLPALAGIAPYAAINFATYDGLKAWAYGAGCAPGPRAALAAAAPHPHPNRSRRTLPRCTVTLPLNPTRARHTLPRCPGLRKALPSCDRCTPHVPRVSRTQAGRPQCAPAF